MNTLQKSAKLVGVLFIIGTVSGIFSLNTASLLNAPDYLVLLAENETALKFGVLSVLIMGFSLSMMSVVLYPVIEAYSETLALGSVIFRGALELVCYLAIAISWLLLLSVSQSYVVSESRAMTEFHLMGETLQSMANLSGSVGLDLVFSLGSIMINYVLLKTNLLPKWLSIWDLVGAVLYLLTPIFLLLGYDLTFLQAVLGVQEMVMAAWLIVKGFNESAYLKILSV
ncbi:DUF4386 domain-containing protein [Fundicoccus culcitae]|uniref:DUF4386 domain-containing protein n=1 Tax=Fundicoccus culcitae TaxID=2969821 RepID=A0ABY5P5L2_9LACT|nr:DUF4386 domain-containing protein [Fundicoccus culcitae]UUX33660.1 DUF4386 domain-containing protein [Fundicoccus culcitae]